MGNGDVMGRRALNRATLHRQRLLAKSGSTVETIEHLGGLQAQNPLDPYYGLWSRIDGFDPEMLSALLVERSAVRAQLMRGTIHLVTTRDYVVMQPLFMTVLERVFRSTSFAKDTANVDETAFLEVSAGLLRTRPMGRSELGRALQERFPGYPSASLAQKATYLLPVVQTTPRGVWGSTGSATWAFGPEWLGRALDPRDSVEDLVIRYLGAFGPASVADMRTWSGLAGLRGVFERLRPALRVWRSEEGTELFDLPDAVHPDPDTPAPPRFLPEYDNVLLGHANRSRFFNDAIPQGWIGNLLVDGMFVGSWKVTSEKNAKRLVVMSQVKLSKADVVDIETEGQDLITFATGSGGTVELTKHD